MTDATRDIEALIELMARLPGLGPRSARRAVLHLIKKRGQVMAPLARAMAEVATTARECATCGNIGTADQCDICRDPRRATGEICVVEDVADLWALDRARLPGGEMLALLFLALACTGDQEADCGSMAASKAMSSTRVAPTACWC